MPVLLIIREKSGGLQKSPIIVEFDPTQEVQADVETKHGGSSSQYYENRAKAEQGLKRAEVDSE